MNRLPIALLTTIMTGSIGLTSTYPTQAHPPPQVMITIPHHTYLPLVGKRPSTPPFTTTPTAIPTATPTATPTPVPTAPPPSPGTILDTFNRADGTLGTAWLGDVGGYAIDAHAAAVIGGGAISYTQPFGEHQTASVTLAALNPNASELGLLLKGQDTSHCNVLKTWYTPATHIVRVATCLADHWTNQGGPMNVTFQPGDRFRVDAFNEGSVNIYKNDVLVGQVQVRNWPYADGGGRIGIWTIDATTTRFDDFGGGSL